MLKFLLPLKILILFCFVTNFGQITLKSSQVTGTWRFEQDEFKILLIKNRKLKIEYAGLWEYKYQGQPIANIGEAKGFAILNGNKAIFKIDEKPKCEMVLKFTKRKLIVEDNGQCEFGRHVNPGGVYRRIAFKKPKFDW